MEKFLDIVIPEYNCKEQDINNLLKSIIRQQSIDLKMIGVIIVNDCSDKKLKKSIFRNYPQLDIEYYIKDKNEGVGMTRQFGLDKSSAKYVTFVDQDDELYGTEALYKLFMLLKDNNYDVVVSNYIEEVLDEKNGIKEFFHSGVDPVEALHGVFFRRQAIIDKDIKFIPDVRYNDDYYYKRILISLFNPVPANFITYLWKYNKQSIVRKERKLHYSVEVYGDFFNALKYKIEFLSSKGCYVCDNFLASLLGAFNLLESTEFDLVDIEEKKKYEKDLYKLICECSEIINQEMDSFDEINRNQYKSQQIHFKELIVKEKFFDFIDRMSKEYPQYSFELKETKPLLSIIVPYYNLENITLMRLLNSILYQRNYKRKELEIVMVSNNSDTAIPQLYLDNQYKKLNIKCCKMDEHKGFGDVCKFGLDNSNGEYVLFLDQYDELNDNFVLMDLMSKLEKEKYDVLYTNFYFNGNTLNSYDNNSLKAIILNRCLFNDRKIFFLDEIVDNNDLYASSILKKNTTNLIYDRRTCICNIKKTFDVESIFSNFDDFFKSYSSIIKYSINKDMSKITILKEIIMLFLLLESDKITQPIDEYEVIIRQYIEFIKNDYMAMNERERKQIIREIIDNTVKDYKIREIRIDFDAFINLNQY